MYTGRVETCSQRIKKALSLRNMKQTDLCKRTKVPKGSLSLYISGAYEPKQDRLYDMANALDVDPVWLMGYDVPMERQKNLPNDEMADLTEGEQMWLELFRRLPESSKPKALLLFDLLEQVPEEKQEMLLDILQVTLKKR